MPLVCSVASPFSGQILGGAWAYCCNLSFDFENKTGRVVYAIYADKTSAYSGYPPIKRVEFAITNTAGEISGVPTFDELVAANATAYGLLLTAIDALALGRADFTGGTVDAN